MTVIDTYLKDINPSQKAVLNHIRKIVKQIVPEVEEVISYDVPTLKYKKKYLIYLAAYKNHMSLYPAPDPMIKVIPELAKFKASKGTLHFTEENPISDSQIKQIVAFRKAKIDKNQ